MRDCLAVVQYRRRFIFRARTESARACLLLSLSSERSRHPHLLDHWIGLDIAETSPLVVLGSQARGAAEVENGIDLAIEPVHAFPTEPVPRVNLRVPVRPAVGEPEPALGGREALEALLSVSAMNAALYASLSPADRAVAFTHPEYGALTIDWLIHQTAGHLLHHLKQLETLATR